MKIEKEGRIEQQRNRQLYKNRKRRSGASSGFLGLFPLLLCLALSGLSFTGNGNKEEKAQKGIQKGSAVTTPKLRIASPERQIYERIDFGENPPLAFEVFQKAWWGHRKAVSEGLIPPEKQDLITVIDFRLHSASPRLWVFDLNRAELVFCDYVAHGQGSGLDFARTFSNRPQSHQSSLGFYKTGEIYLGRHGKSLRLHGLEKGFNHRAFERAIVLHGADYVSPSFIQGQHRLGRSRGCPAVSRDLAPVLIDRIAEGTALFIFAADPDYLRGSEWIRPPRTLAEAGEERDQVGIERQEKGKGLDPSML